MNVPAEGGVVEGKGKPLKDLRRVYLSCMHTQEINEVRNEIHP